MRRLLKKVNRFGLRRALIFVAIKMTSKARVFFYRALFSDNKAILNNATIMQATQFVGKGKIIISNARFGVWPSPGLISGCGYIEARAASAEVTVGDSTFINNGFVIIADRSKIRIGKRCLIGPNFFVVDSDFHGLDLANRTSGIYECAPVTIEDDVFIGEGVKIMKGVTVGQGSVIGCGSVVVKDIEPFSVCAGVPAIRLKSLT